MKCVGDERQVWAEDDGRVREDVPRQFGFVALLSIT